jgi:3-methyl-2-oxobutanoate hydroxymethyltransferase
MLLVGDSLGNVVLGYETTVPVTLGQMIHHASAVMRAKPQALVIVDMPFLSFQVSPPKALEAAGRIIKKSGADAVKLEGGERNVAAIRRIVQAGIPVCGHLGLTPQSVLALGGYPLQGKGAEGDRLLEEAKMLETAGCFCLVLEKVPAALAARVTAALSIPTIGIGAGAGCDGQVLVLHDLLGLTPAFQPRFVKRYAEVGEIVIEAAARYCAEVRQGVFPAKEHEYQDTTGKRAGRAAKADTRPDPDASSHYRAEPAEGGGASAAEPAEGGGASAAESAEGGRASAAESAEGGGASAAEPTQSRGASRSPNPAPRPTPATRETRANPAVKPVGKKKTGGPGRGGSD